MKFYIFESPDPRQWPLGKELSLVEAAQLLEINAGLLAAHSRKASVAKAQGFQFEIIREEGDPQPKADEGNDGKDSGPQSSGGWKPYGKQ